MARSPPSQIAGLQADPTLIKTAGEEFLRLDSSNQLGNGITTTAASIGGRVLPVGSLITLRIGAASRDPAQFCDRDRLRGASSMTRPNSNGPVWRQLSAARSASRSLSFLASSAYGRQSRREATNPGLSSSHFSSDTRASNTLPIRPKAIPSM